jgi:hypothetical protein
MNNNKIHYFKRNISVYIADNQRTATKLYNNLYINADDVHIIFSFLTKILSVFKVITIDYGLILPVMPNKVATSHMQLIKFNFTLSN